MPQNRQEGNYVRESYLIKSLLFISLLKIWMAEALGEIVGNSYWIGKMYLYNCGVLVSAAESTPGVPGFRHVLGGQTCLMLLTSVRHFFINNVCAWFILLSHHHNDKIRDNVWIKIKSKNCHLMFCEEPRILSACAAVELIILCLLSAQLRSPSCFALILFKLLFFFFLINLIKNWRI